MTSGPWGPLSHEIAEVAAGSWQHKAPPEIRGTGYCVDALEAALWAVNEADGFADAVLRAANLGDDADTTAAIAGQLAGARWGAEAIPQTWRNKLTDAPRIASLARNLAIAGGATPPRNATGLPVWVDDQIIHGWWANQRVLIGEYPGAGDFDAGRKKLDLLVDHGIRTFVNLTSQENPLPPYEDQLETVAAARDVDLVHLPRPIPNMGVLADEDYDRILDDISAAKSRGGVYVHCLGGVGRAGTVAGCVLVDDGFDGESALRRMTELRHGYRKAAVASPQTAAQIDVIRRRGQRRR